MNLFNIHKHDWKCVGTHIKYWYRFPSSFANSYQTYNQPIKWGKTSWDYVVSSGVKTAIVQKCKLCKKFRTQWINGEYKIGEDGE